MWNLKFTVATMKNAVFWDAASWGFITNRRFEGRCRLHLQGRRHDEGEEKCQTVTNVKLVLFLLPWRWRQHVPPKRKFIINSHGATSQKTGVLQRLRYYRRKLWLWYINGDKSTEKTSYSGCSLLGSKHICNHTIQYSWILLYDENVLSTSNCAKWKGKF
jgi:hypothetical protein